MKQKCCFKTKNEKKRQRKIKIINRRLRDKEYSVPIKIWITPSCMVWIALCNMGRIALNSNSNNLVGLNHIIQTGSNAPTCRGWIEKLDSVWTATSDVIPKRQWDFSNRTKLPCSNINILFGSYLNILPGSNLSMQPWTNCTIEPSSNSTSSEMVTIVPCDKVRISPCNIGQIAPFNLVQIESLDIFLIVPFDKLRISSCNFILNAPTNVIRIAPRDMVRNVPHNGVWSVTSFW